MTKSQTFSGLTGTINCSPGKKIRIEVVSATLAPGGDFTIARVQFLRSPQVIARMITGTMSANVDQLTAARGLATSPAAFQSQTVATGVFNEDASDTAAMCGLPDCWWPHSITIEVDISSGSAFNVLVYYDEENA